MTLRHCNHTADLQNMPCSFLTHTFLSWYCSIPLPHLAESFWACFCHAFSSSFQLSSFLFLPFLNLTCPALFSLNPYGPEVCIIHLTGTFITYSIPLKPNCFVDVILVSLTWAVSTWNFHLVLLLVLFPHCTYDGAVHLTIINSDNGKS